MVNSVENPLNSFLMRLYKFASAKDGAIAKDANLEAMMGEVGDYSAKITTAIKADKVSAGLDGADSKSDALISRLFTLLAGGYAYSGSPCSCCRREPRTPIPLRWAVGSRSR